MARFLALLLAALVLAGLLPDVAEATTRTSCVKTAGELQLAIFWALGDPEGSVENIKLVQGNYSIDGFKLVTSAITTIPGTEDHPDDRRPPDFE